MAGVKESDVRLKPFPHIVIKDAIDPEVFRHLSSIFPPHQAIMGNEEEFENTRYDLHLRNIKGNEKINQDWFDFGTAQTNAKHHKEFLRLFKKPLLAAYPDLIDRFGNRQLEDLNTGAEGLDNDLDIQYTFSLATNSPSRENVMSVRGPHLDMPIKLYGSLLYFRKPEDKTPGGNLRLYSFKNGKPKLKGKLAHNCDIEILDEVEYSSNVYVLFMNTIHSLHGVSERGISDYSRDFCYMAAKVPFHLYDEKPYQEGFFDKVRRRLIYNEKTQPLSRASVILANNEQKRD